MILNIYKPIGWTSFDVVKKVRNITHEKKVGHAGSLDPFAEGVLVIGTGKDTKRLAAITASSKSYEAVLKLGCATATHDPTGLVTEKAAIPVLSAKRIEGILQSFQGEQNQIPPMYSAKKVAGQRLYKLARKNITVERKPDQIIIHTIELLNWTPDIIAFRVTCSKGTYIRVLGTDIATRLGTVGHLTKLVRTQVGKYTLETTLTIEQLMAKWKSSAA
ncbi:MAG: tRNA pseudouridine(55) synthase TruB [Candidatus Marinimicrobia bacterium]|nr:tRNA pseudouridine(55) synthase TruB [Candidatus Neomarinimicrobiota bacterium]